MQNSRFRRHLRLIALSDLAHSSAISGFVGLLAVTSFTRPERSQSGQTLGFERFELDFSRSPTFSCPLGWQLMEPSFGARRSQKGVPPFGSMCNVEPGNRVGVTRQKQANCQLICIFDVALEPGEPEA